MQLGMLALVAGTDIAVMSEPWTGVLFGLSLAAYRWRQSGIAVGLGLLALFVRELAAPYWCRLHARCGGAPAAARRGRVGSDAVRFFA